jgi:hypothetical protein
MERPNAWLLIAMTLVTVGSVAALLALRPQASLGEVFAIPATIAMVLLIWWPHITANEEKTDGQT